MSMTRPAQQVDPDAARDAARHILSDRRYRAEAAPRPLRGPLEWLGDRLRPVLERIGDVLGYVPSWLALALALAFVVGAVARVVVVSRRRRVTGGVPGAGADAPAPDGHEDPAALERAADEAERDGDLERALRLRFRAGLLRLGDRGAIRYRPSVTTSEVRRALGSETFDELAGTFDAVAYGGRPAGAPDVDTARREWPHVLDEAKRR
jgi:hypothetical protein